MNIEINSIQTIRRWLQVRPNGGKVMNAVRTALHRLAAAERHVERDDVQRAAHAREQYSAIATAQLNAYRFNR